MLKLMADQISPTFVIFASTFLQIAQDYSSTANNIWHQVKAQTVNYKNKTVEFQFFDVLSSKKTFRTGTQTHNTNCIDENLQSATLAVK